MAFEEDGKIYIKLDERGQKNMEDTRWDDGAGGQIKKIFLWHNDDLVSGIQTIYARNGADLISQKHGGSEGNLVTINPKRPLTWVSGHYGTYHFDPELSLDEEEAPWNFDKVIKSLKFGNDEETYGPFGYENGTPFFYHATTEITGFHGSSSDATPCGYGFISSIGFYIKTDAVGFLGKPSMSSTNKVGR